MKTGQLCTRDTVTATRNTSLAQASKHMRDNHVGSVVVVDQANPRRPVGILTDRDIVVEVLAAGLDYRTMTVGEILSDALVVAWEDDDALATLRTMRRTGVRRIPVVDAGGALAGMVSLDDLLRMAGSALEDIAATIGLEQSVESERRARLAS